jgi:succinyl-CoA synthetase (ADP-forming) beta subunit (EC 6.2.1.5)
MRLHEFQAKEIFEEAGIPVPESKLADSVEGVVDAVDEIGFPAAVKAQVHVGGRGKAGGIKIATSEDEAREAAEDILGMELKGYTVDRVLVEQGVDFDDEYYVGVTMDRGAGEPVAMVSTKGGVDIEAVAEDDPDAIAQEHIDPASGFSRIRPARSSTMPASPRSTPARCRRSSRRSTSSTRPTTPATSKSTPS